MQIVMTMLGLTMTEGTVSRWLVAAGQAVKQGEILFEFESEKSVMEFESPAAGVIGQLLVSEGQTVPCGTSLVILGTQAVIEAAQSLDEKGLAAVNATPAAKRRARELGVDLVQANGRGVNGRIHLLDVEAMDQTFPASVIDAKTPSKPSEDLPQRETLLPVEATPLAKRLATDLGIDLTQIQGSGPGERIVREDVLTAARVERAESIDPSQSSPAILTPFSHKEALSGVRGVIAQRMSSSASSAAHVTLHSEVDATNLVTARQQLNEELAGATKISYNALLVAIAARALHEQPQINACLQDDEIITYAEINVALAVDTERGLLVPVIRHADQLSILEIQQRGDELIQRALAGKSVPDDLSGGTFTITNLGMYGVDSFTPIINQPQAAILGVGRIVNKPVGLDGSLVLRDRLTLSLSFDHRIVDGREAVTFLVRVKEGLEDPARVVLDL